MSMLNQSSSSDPIHQPSTQNQTDNISLTSTNLRAEFRELYNKFGAKNALESFTGSHKYLSEKFVRALFIQEILPLALHNQMSRDGEQGIRNFELEWKHIYSGTNFSLDSCVLNSKRNIYRDAYRESGEPSANEKMKLLFPTENQIGWNIGSDKIRESVRIEAIKDVITDRLGMAALFLVYNKYDIDPLMQRHYERTVLTPLIEREAAQLFTSSGPKAVCQLLDQLEIPTNSDIAIRIKKDLEHTDILRKLLLQEGAAGAERFRFNYEINDNEWKDFYNPRIRIPHLGDLLIEELKRNGSESIDRFKHFHLISDDDWDTIIEADVKPFILELCRETVNQLGFHEGVTLVEERFSAIPDLNRDQLVELLIRSASSELSSALSDNVSSAKVIFEAEQRYKLPGEIWIGICKECALPWFRNRLSELATNVKEKIIDLDKIDSDNIKMTLLIEHLNSPDWLLSDPEVRSHCEELVYYMENSKPSLRMAEFMRKAFKIT